jgi:hypothetical protein
VWIAISLSKSLSSVSEGIFVRVIYHERAAYNFDGVGASRIAMPGQPDDPKRAAAYLLVFEELKFLD